MAIRILSVIITSVLTGGTSQSIVKNLPQCSGLVATPQAKAAPCMTNAEYYTARKKAQHSEGKPTAAKDEEVESRYKDRVP